jgi:hypothetical protein
MQAVGDRQVAGRPTRTASGRGAALRRVPLLLLLLAAVAGGVSCGRPVATEAPEAAKVLAVQSRLPFQIMIPAYLPKDFDRAQVGIKVDTTGPGGEPMVELTYRTGAGASLTLQEWVPVNPSLEILAASRPIQTKWGRGWLLNQAGQLVAVWADVGPTRVSVFTTDVSELPAGKILTVAETLGPASNKQVFSFDAQPRTIKEMKPPAPFVVPVNSKGVQALTLVVTPGGYSPLRFSVKKGVPVELTFRQLGQVGCGNELLFPSDPNNPAELKLKSAADQQVLKFTPETVGTFQFYCSHQMYRGLVTVRQ